MNQDQTPKKKSHLGIKIALTVIFANVLGYVELILFMFAAMMSGGAQVGFILLSLMPPLVFVLIWLPKTKKFMMPLGSVFTLLVIAMGVSFGMHAHNEAQIINTTPAIIVDEYLPFDENSKIVKFRSKSVNFDHNPPIIDGAAALFPVYSGFVNATYPEDTRLFDDVFKYNNTPKGYRALAERKTDLFIGVYPSKEQISYAEEQETHFVYTPIGYDAFVFFVHKDNPIDSLSADQIRAIYAGEITNWKELGGKNEKIVAYQRNEGSGSQSMLYRFMGDKRPMQAPSETINSMGDIIDVVADYRSDTASIGFSFRFYVEGIIQNPDIKMIAIDGVYPTADNIRDESYPIRTPFYAVTYEENQNPNTHKLINWMLSREGQYIIEETGYVGVNKQE